MAAPKRRTSKMKQRSRLAAKAWKVDDWMGDYMVYGGPLPVISSNGTTVYNSIVAANPDDFTNHAYGTPDLVWDILGSKNP